MSIVRIGLSDAGSEKLTTTTIYESHSSRIILVEPDPDHSKKLFVLEDEQKLVRIEDNDEGKAMIGDSTDLSYHDLE